ncbi:MAG: hypothetical protein GC182_23735 [Rhodopseudomonas sp.]|nr:hypothetical protein [Rhodopseudomonas sp.]
MRMIILSTLFALGVGIAGAPAASAAPISGLSTAVPSASMVEDVQYYYRRRPVCRTVRVCRYSRYERRRICHLERVCRRGW